jgi:predicted nucleic acid-binding protein
MPAVIVDSGFLVALGIRRDPRHASAKAFLNRYKGELIVPAPVIVESCFFFSTAAKIAFVDWLAKTPVLVADLPPEAYAEISPIMARYASLEPDFTDAAIVWLADRLGCRRILTVDSRDFGVYRLKNGKQFEILKWFK